jgi:cobyrinic acid a,c-diamide synthase
MLKAAIESACRTPVLGWMPREPALTIPERHLGLHGASAHAADAATLDTFTDVAERHLEMDRIVALARGSAAARMDVGPPASTPNGEPVRIGVARDQAFSFYYEDNLDLLREAGAEIVPFSPLNDHALPDDLDAIYLGGGYPELHAAALSANSPMLRAMRDFAVSGRPVYAECGGMIYLGEHLTGLDGQVHAMAGVLPISFAMTDRLVSFGYVTVQVTQACLIGEVGTEVRGHSFHYSRVVAQPDLPASYTVSYSLSGREEQEGFRSGNVLASYVHLHFRGNIEIAGNFVRTVRKIKASRLVAA